MLVEVTQVAPLIVHLHSPAPCVQRANNSVQDVKSLPVVGWDARSASSKLRRRSVSRDESRHKELHSAKYFLFDANAKTNG